MTKTERNNNFELIFKKNYKQLYLYSSYIINDFEAAKDVVSDIFCKLWNEYANVDLDKIDSYLFLAVRNKSFDFLRHKKVVNSYVETYIKEINICNSNSLKVYNEKLDHIYDLINKMPSKTRFVIEQCYLGDKTYKEVAAILEISTSSIKKHIMIGLKIIRNDFMVNYKKGK